jgi:hypothetical protein
MMRIWKGFCDVTLGLSLLGAFSGPTAAWAQAGFYVTPSLSVAEVYDDNVFITASRREQDLISRVSPAIQLGYQSTPLTLLGSYSSDAEVFIDHPELSRAFQRQQASINVRYLPTAVLTLSLASAYAYTQTPRDINEPTGIETGRGPARSYSLAPSINYQFDPLTAGTGGYSFTKSEQSAGVAGDAHTVNMGLSRRLTQWDAGDIGYTFRFFSFDGDNTTTSHAFTLGWIRQLTPLTSITLRGGPRFSESSVDAEASASLSRQIDRGQLSLNYTRSQNVVAGLAGAVTTDSVSATIAYQLAQFLQVTAAPRFSRSVRGNLETRVYGVGLNATYQLNRWLSLQGSYQFSLQQGDLVSTTVVDRRGNEEIYHNILSLGLAMTYPYRVY